MKGALLLAAVLLAGCMEQGSGTPIERGMTRVDDHERGVACYVYRGIKKGGISCLRTEAPAVEPAE